MQGSSTTIASSPVITIPDSTSYNSGSFTLTGPQADSITNYNDLRIKFVAFVESDQSSSNGNRRGAEIGWAQFQISDTVAPDTTITNFPTDPSNISNPTFQLYINRSRINI